MMPVLKPLVAFLVTMLLFLPGRNLAQDAAALIKEAEALEPTSQEAALKKYEAAHKLQNTNVYVLCKISVLCSTIGRRQPTKNGKINYYKAARSFAEVALRLKPDNSEANFAMAVAMGRMALVLGGKQKIEAVYDIKKYAELAIKYDPNNYKAYHVLGKWHYEVSNLNGVERTAAKVFYGGLPPASLKDAIYFYEKSKSINSEFLINYLELAKAYYANRETNKAIALLKQLANMPGKTQDDGWVKEEGKELLKEWTK